MKIQTLKDIKEALKKIPDEVLEKFGWAVGEDCEDMDLCCFT
jgi:hypothetical protein